ncbi:MAG: hypothetical protein R3F41_20560 [Gammaproteobacteria bacterium]|nr:hypothetical protein [Pseudomonadales bacterium]
MTAASGMPDVIQGLTEAATTQFNTSVLAGAMLQENVLLPGFRVAIVDVLTELNEVVEPQSGLRFFGYRSGVWAT